MGDSIGVDVSKHHLDWVVGGEGDVTRVPNTPIGIRRMVAKFRRLDAAWIVVESTGGYERALIEALSGAGLPVVLVNPWRVRRFGEGLGPSEGRFRVPDIVSWPIAFGGAGS